MGGCGQGEAGGIFELSRLSVQHRSELVADFREFFHTSTDLPVFDSVALVRALLNDPRSRLHAAVAGWSHPTSWEAITLADIFDLQLRSKLENKSDFKPYPRPSDAVKPQGRRRSAAEAMRILRPHKVDQAPPA